MSPNKTDLTIPEENPFYINFRLWDHKDGCMNSKTVPFWFNDSYVWITLILTQHQEQIYQQKNWVNKTTWY